MSVLIQGVEQHSPAMLAGLRAGMHIVSIDGHPIVDGLDYEFFSSAAHLSVLLRNESGEHTVSVCKDEYQPLGCTFATYLIDKQHSCRNACVFCFIDQLPKGLREPLYFKDDDERLGFLFGNYITLTNLTEREINRIISMHISPVNISVHTANPELRVRMMRNKSAGEVLRFIPMLAKAGIAMNTQLVLCPGLNDGDELRRSIEWLASMRPAVQSIAAVPLGLTSHRAGLEPLATYTSAQAAAQLSIMLEYGECFKAEPAPEWQEATRLVYPSDEWFLLAGREIPDADFYDGYPQLENGVGMWRLLHDEFMQALEDVSLEHTDIAKQNECQEGQTLGDGIFGADIVVGQLAAPLFIHLAEALKKRFPKANLYVHEVQNNFFGPNITVTGLLTGTDILAQVHGRLHTGTLLLPAVTLRAEGDIMLDGTTTEQLSGALATRVKVVQQGGENLLCAILQSKM